MFTFGSRGLVQSADCTNPRDPLLRRLSLASVDFPRFKLNFLNKEARKSISVSHSTSFRSKIVNYASPISHSSLKPPSEHLCIRDPFPIKTTHKRAIVIPTDRRVTRRIHFLTITPFSNSGKSRKLSNTLPCKHFCLAWLTIDTTT